MRLYANQPIGAVPRARCLRRDAPEPERRLLRGLREAFPDLKWRHQAPLGPFCVDILCFSERLVIEVDGDTHAFSMNEDAKREAFMRAQGYYTLRFSNADVMDNLEGVIAHISFSLWEKEGARSAQPSGKDEDSLNTKKGSAA
jgi:very-short-patch-repair endonuclease